MPIPLGVLAVAGAGAGPVVAGNAYEWLETQILTDSNSASVTFSNLNSTYGSTYQHLQLRMTGRSTRATGTTTVVYVRLNGDTGSNYAYHALYRSTVLGSFGSSSQTYGYAGETSQATTTSNVFGAFVMDILDPFETTKYTTMRTLGGVATDWLSLASSVWMNTNAVTSIQIIAEPSNNWVTGSRFSLYGLRSS